jgi:heat shock protein HslJ
MRRAWILLAVTVAAVAAVAVASARSDALTGNVWVLTAVRGKAPLHGTEITSAFTPAGNVSGSAGCNHYGGTFTVSGGAIRISSLVSTLMGCPPKIAAQESAFLKALAAARAYHVAGGKLTLETAGGRTLLTYRARARR